MEHDACLDLSNLLLLPDEPKMREASQQRGYTASRPSVKVLGEGFGKDEGHLFVQLRLAIHCGDEDCVLQSVCMLPWKYLNP